MKPPPTSPAVRRAEVVVKVWAGLLTAKAAAAQLGISRKSYYQWEARGLRGLISEMEERPTGRPRKTRPDPENASLKRQLAKSEDSRAKEATARELREDLAAWRRSLQQTRCPAAGHEKKRP